MGKGVYAIFAWSYALQQFLMRRVTPSGAIVIAALSITLVAGGDTNQTLAYQIFAFLLSLLGTSFLFIGRFACLVKVQRLLPRVGTVDQVLQYRIVVQNQSLVPQSGLSLFEVFADPRPSFPDWQAAIAEVDTTHALPWWRRVSSQPIGKISALQWTTLLNRKRGAKVRVLEFPPLPPKGRSEVVLELTPLHRGRVEFAGVVLARPDPLGLLNAVRFIPLPQSFWILPARFPVPPIALPGHRRYQSGGVSLASIVGETEEFRALRDYRPGDPLRKIHWKSWAKTGKPIVKEEQDEFFVRHALILDTFQSQSLSPKLEAAISIAASLACTYHTEDALLDLMFVGTEAYCFTSGRSLGHIEQMLQILAAVRACSQSAFESLTALVLGRSHLLSGCICVFLTWDDARSHLVRSLQALQLPLMVFILKAEGEDIPTETLPLNSELTIVHLLSSDRLAESLAALQLKS